MTKIPFFQVDAFTDKQFKGNPAAVCILNEWLTESIMQSIASENNLAETAFIVTRTDHFEIRWFTPKVEVDLCGHATLASAFVIYNYLGYDKHQVVFLSRHSGQLNVTRQNDTFFLDFPTDIISRSNDTEIITKCLGEKPTELFRGKSDYIALLDSELKVKHLNVDIPTVSKLKARGLIVTSQGDEVDFVSRFFAPQSGIDEDPVTGSAHTSLIPIWSARLNKTKMTARQLSLRGGQLVCENMGNRSIIGGKATLFIKGEIYLE